MKNKYEPKIIENKLNLKEFQAVILSIAHDEFKKLDLKIKDKQVLFDIKSVLEKNDGRL